MSTKIRNHSLSIAHGMRGFYVVYTAEFNDGNDGGNGWYRDVICTGYGSYKSSKEAEEEAYNWSKAETIPFAR